MTLELSSWLKEVLGVLQKYSTHDETLKEQIRQERPTCLKKSILSTHYKQLRALVKDSLSWKEGVVFPLLPPPTSSFSVNEMCCRLFSWLFCQHKNIFTFASKETSTTLRTLLEEKCANMVLTNEAILLFQLESIHSMIQKVSRSFQDQKSLPVQSMFDASAIEKMTMEALRKTHTSSSSSASTNSHKKNKKTVLDKNDVQMQTVQSVFLILRQINKSSSYDDEDLHLIQKMFACCLLYMDMFWKEAATSTRQKRMEPFDYIENKVINLFFDVFIFHEEGLHLNPENLDVQETYLAALASWLSHFANKCGEVVDYQNYYQEVATELIEQFQKNVKTHSSTKTKRDKLTLQTLLEHFPDLFQEAEVAASAIVCPPQTKTVRKKTTQQRKSSSSSTLRI